MESATNDVLTRYNKAQVDSYIAIRDAQLMLLQSKVNRAESVSTQTLVQKMKENGVPQDVAEALAKLVTD